MANLFLHSSLNLVLAESGLPTDYSSYSLHTYAYDDSDPIISYEGAWATSMADNWPGGASYNQFHYAVVISPITPPTQFTTGVFTVAGTVEEGIRLLGAVEDTGPGAIYLQPLDEEDTSWRLFAASINSLAYRYERNPTSDPYQAASYYVGYEDGFTQSNWRELNRPFFGLFGLPAGRYRLRFVKLVNSSSENDARGDKATYFDGLTIHTRVPSGVPIQDGKWTSANSRPITNKHIIFKGLGNYLPSSSVTIEFWANTHQALPTVVFGNQSAGEANTGGRNRLMAHLPWPDGNMYWDYGDIGNGTINANGRSACQLPSNYFNTWHHYAFVSDAEANKMQIFIDGELLLQADNHDSYKRTDEDFYIGWWIYSDIVFNGSIGEFRIWDYARNAAQIQADIPIIINSAKPGLLACWRLDDTGSVIVDRSGNNYHGIIS
jgi:hypothetical protein